MDIINKFSTNMTNLVEKLHLSSFIVAVSGGSDSLGLAFLLKHWQENHKVNIINIIIDHNLRPTSHLEAKQTLKILSDNAIPAEIIKWENPFFTGNLQQQARIARYQLLTNYCIKNHYEAILTAHQQNDQAETLLMRIIRGSGLYGLAGIPMLNNFGSIKIIRPLLGFSKHEIKEYLKSIGIKWIEDPSNLNHDFTRVKIRKFIDRNKILLSRLNKLSSNLTRVKECVDYFVDNFVTNHCDVSQEQIFFELEYFNSLPLELRFRIINKLILQMNYKINLLKGEKVENLLKKFTEVNFSAATLGGCLFKKAQNKIFITKEKLNIQN